jgi:hypothetical protein
LLLGFFLELLLVMRAKLPHPLRSRHLFLRPDGHLAQQYYFLYHYLRLVVLQLQALLARRNTLGKINASTAIITNSLRRGGSTTAANAGAPKYIAGGVRAAPRTTWQICMTRLGLKTNSASLL